jgi:predicted secreted hydrolase
MNTFSRGKLVFPRDEGYHHAAFDWWYLTAHLVSKSGRKFDYTVAYISRNFIEMTRQTSITDELKKTYYGQLMNGPFTSERGSLNLNYSNIEGDRDNWRQKENTLFNYILHTEIRNLFDLTINLSAIKPPIAHGFGGIIQMGRGGPSFYYSQTNLKVDGMFLCNKTYEPVHGIAWIDRQWGSWNPEGYGGWEWFAIQLNDNTEIMLYLFFDLETGSRISSVLSVVFDDGTFTSASGESEFSLEYLGFWEIPNRFLIERLTGAKQYFSSGWRLTIPKHKIHLTITPHIQNQMVGLTSWEGSCYVGGTRNSVPIEGVATVELTHRHGERSPLRWAAKALRKLPLIHKLTTRLV